MYSHVQTNAQGAFLRLIPAGVLIEWDGENFCTAFALEADEKAEQFRLHSFYTTSQPAHDPRSHGVRELAPVLSASQWMQQWEVYKLTPEQAEVQRKARVPTACTRRQGRLALLQAGKLSEAESAIASIPDHVQRSAAQIEYEADTWERANPFLQRLWAGMGGTEQELDELFALAVTL